MVVKSTPEQRQQRINEERMRTPEDIQKENMLSELRKESMTVVALAYMYAKNFETLGFDVTRCLMTAEQNVKYLEAAYKQGVDDTIARYRDKGVTINENKGKNS